MSGCLAYVCDNTTGRITNKSFYKIPVYRKKWASRKTIVYIDMYIVLIVKGFRRKFVLTEVNMPIDDKQ